MNVQEPNGGPVSGFRWLVQEDTTHPVTPGSRSSRFLLLSASTKVMLRLLSTAISDSSTADINVPSDIRYMVSVLPDASYAMSGKLSMRIRRSVTVVVNKMPIPTAQITIFVLSMIINPINNAQTLNRVWRVLRLL